MYMTYKCKCGMERTQVYGYDKQGVWHKADDLPEFLVCHGCGGRMVREGQNVTPYPKNKLDRYESS